MENMEREQLHQAAKIARRQILDLLQATYGHEPSWRNVRARILRILGRDGLEQQFLQNSPNRKTRDSKQWESNKENQ